MTTIDQLTTLSVDALEERIASLVRTERLTTADLILSLAELYRRHLDDALGFSLWTYCHEHHRMPEATATRYSRIATLLVDYPAAKDYLRDGRLNPSTLNLLHNALTPHNHLLLLERASGLTMNQVEHLLAELNPQPDIEETVRFVPDRTPIFRERATTASLDLGTTPSPTSNLEVAPAPAPRPASIGNVEVNVREASPEEISQIIAATAERFAPSAELKVRRPGHYSLKLNIDQATLDELNEVKSALSHIMPGANFAKIVRECIRRTRTELARRQRAELAPARNPRSKAPATSNLEVSPPATSNLEVSPPAASNLEVELRNEAQFLPVELRPKRRPSADVVRAVWARDGGRCAFVGLKGHRCNSTHQLELDHWRAWARGGEATVENIQVLCRRHNIYRAIQTFGEERMKRYVRARSPKTRRAG